MRRRAEGGPPPAVRRVPPLMEGAAFVVTAVLAVVVMVFEATPPITTLRFMLMLHRLEWRAVGLMAPLALGAAATLVCLVMAAATAGRTLTPRVWLWLMSGAFIAPAVSFGGYRIVIYLMSGRSS